MKNCVVEDIGGFLYFGRPSVKRSPRFLVSSMVLSLDSLEVGALSAEPSFHVLHGLLGATGEEQAIYALEVGSAVYALTFNLNLDGIGMLSVPEAAEGESAGEQEKGGGS